MKKQKKEKEEEVQNDISTIDYCKVILDKISNLVNITILARTQGDYNNIFRTSVLNKERYFNVVKNWKDFIFYP